ncbi:MAG: 50S ribosomal protein L9 [Planctomycetota bacterium]|nr:50S ribosomal protein L9 [Planctomycetota bacterium]
MKVLLRQTVDKLGYVGDVVNVKPGYARNYLLPQGLAMEPTEANLKAIEAAKQAYLRQLARERAELEARARLLDGKEITVAARANEEGHLYGSVGPAQIVAALDQEGFGIEARNVILGEAISVLDKYDVTIRFSKDISAKIGLWVVRLGDSDQSSGEETESVSENDNDTRQQQDAEEK